MTQYWIDGRGDNAGEIRLYCQNGMDEVAATEDAIRALTVKKEVIVDDGRTRRVFTSDARFGDSGDILNTRLQRLVFPPFLKAK